MKQLNRSLLLLVFILSGYFSLGQMGQYRYKRALPEKYGQWNKIILPPDLFGKILPDFSDIRIFGITNKNDTLTAPYLLRVDSNKKAVTAVDFILLNQSGNSKGYYFTFEIPAANSINQLDLLFKQENFDWRVKLEGSHNQQEWFTLVDEYRILSISNKLTQYLFNTITFSNANYQYYRLFVNSKEHPLLQKATITRQVATAGIYNNYTVGKTSTTEDKQRMQTIIDLLLPMPVPVSYLKIHVHDTLDYYRTVLAQYPVDSFKNQAGWQYNYEALGATTLSAVEKNELNCISTIVQKIQVVIDNQDNQPLKIDSIEVKGYQHAIIARFAVPATYYVVYGNTRASLPNYDISRFADKIPDALKMLDAGKEMPITNEELPTGTALFQNKIWLWVIMVLIIAVLGFFTFNMMKKAGGS